VLFGCKPPQPIIIVVGVKEAGMKRPTHLPAGLPGLPDPPIFPSAKDIPPNSVISGFPAIDHKKDLEQQAALRRLLEA